MHEPQHQIATQSQFRTGEDGDLWKEAPAWRNLSFVAVGLTIVATTLILPPMMQAAATSATPSVAQVATHAAPPVGPLSGGGSVLVQGGAAPSASATPPAVAPAVAQQAARQQTHAAPAPIQTASLTQPNNGAAQHQAFAQQPLVQPLADTQPAACQLGAPPTPSSGGTGVIASLEDPAVSRARIPLTQSQLHGQIDPAYADNLRVTVRMGSGQAGVLLVPRSMTVHVGDRVSVQGLYRNLNLPCNYVPGLITADLGPAPAPAAPTPPVKP